MAHSGRRRQTEAVLVCGGTRNRPSGHFASTVGPALGVATAAGGCLLSVARLLPVPAISSFVDETHLGLDDLVERG